MTVYIYAGAWGHIKLPIALDGVIEYVRSMVLDKPTPDWFFEFLDVCGGRKYDDP